MISISVLAAYAATVQLVKYGQLKMIAQRKFWNVVLLIFFLVSGVLGLAMAYIIDQGIRLSWYPQMLTIHVRSGIVMAIIALIHTFWHLGYYKAIIKRNR